MRLSSSGGGRSAPFIGGREPESVERQQDRDSDADRDSDRDSDPDCETGERSERGTVSGLAPLARSVGGASIRPPQDAKRHDGAPTQTA